MGRRECRPVRGASAGRPAVAQVMDVTVQRTDVRFNRGAGSARGRRGRAHQLLPPDEEPPKLEPPEKLPPKLEPPEEKELLEENELLDE